MAWDSAVLTTQNREHLNTFEAKQSHLVFQYFIGLWTSEGDGFVDFFHDEHSPIGNLSMIPTGDDGYRCRQEAWSFLASEENYQVVRDLQMKNLLISIVGDFAGPSAV